LSDMGFSSDTIEIRDSDKKFNRRWKVILNSLFILSIFLVFKNHNHESY
jgi:uncharacterized integral membrane protein